MAEKLTVFNLDEVEKAIGGRIFGRKRVRGIQGVSIDSRTLRPGDLFFAIRGRQNDGHNFMKEAQEKGASAFVVEISGFQKQEVDGFENVIVVSDTTDALGRLAEFHRRRYQIPVCAITGSCGKTTTKDMAALLLGKFYKLHSTPGNFNNQFGLPLTLFQLSKDHNLMVAELGASRPGDIAALAECLKPRWGVITNVHPAHLEGLGSLEAVYRVKLELADALEKEKGTLVIPGYDKKLVREAEKRSLKLVTFGIGEGFHYSVTETQVREEGIDFEINRRVRFRIQSQGLFNVSNAAAAIALASELGVPLEAMPKSLRKFRPLSGRFETLFLSPGVVVVHDAYNANPASMRASLESFRRIPNVKRRILVLGDMLELGCEAENFHREIGREVASMKPDCLITLGKNAQKIAEEAKASGERARTVSEVTHCANHGEVTALLLEKLSPGDGVLLKASHSMDFEKVVEFLKSHLGVMRCSTASSQ